MSGLCRSIALFLWGKGGIFIAINSEQLEAVRSSNTSFFNHLQAAYADGILSKDEMQIKASMREKEIIEAHLQHHTISQGTGKDKRWRTRLPDGSDNGKGRQVKAQTREDLEEKIVEFYLEEHKKNNAITLRKLFPKYIERKSMEKLRDASITRYKDVWNKYFDPDTDLMDADLEEVTTGQFKDWILKLLDTHPMKRKCYGEIRTVLNGIINYAVEMDYLPYNKFRDVTISKNCFLPDLEDVSRQVFTADEIQKVVTYLWDKYESDPDCTVPLAVLFQFQTGLRAGELEAIRFSDLDEDGFLHVKREQVKAIGPDGKLSIFRVEERTKSKSRSMPVYVSQEGRHILSLAKKANLKNGDAGEDYVFYNHHKLLSTASLDGCLVTACNKVGIPGKRSHKVRKTVATLLANADVDSMIMKSMMGHASVDTTSRYYIKDNHTRTETASAVERALQVSVPPCTTNSEEKEAPKTA